MIDFVALTRSKAEHMTEGKKQWSLNLIKYNLNFINIIQ